MDEPTRGIDPRAATELRRLMREQLLRGKTALVATHDMLEVEQVCDRVLGVDCGTVVDQPDLGSA